MYINACVYTCMHLCTREMDYYIYYLEGALCISLTLFQRSNCTQIQFRKIQFVPKLQFNCLMNNIYLSNTQLQLQLKYHVLSHEELILIKLWTQVPVIALIFHSSRIKNMKHNHNSICNFSVLLVMAYYLVGNVLYDMPFLLQCSFHCYFVRLRMINYS